MKERDFIRDHLSRIAGEGAEGLQDDCAWLPYSNGWLAVSTDTSVEGVHFPSSVKGAAATERAVRVAASDIAAKGADPVGMLVNLSIPGDTADPVIAALALGIEEAGRALGLPLLGGDTTRHIGLLTISVTVFGQCKRKILRSGAEVGDTIWISGPIGGGLAGLRYLQGNPLTSKPSGEDLMHWEEAFLRPDIPINQAGTIQTAATASLDVSDGLLADARHISEASGVGLVLDSETVPLFAGTEGFATESVENLVTLLSAGDDYAALVTGTSNILAEAGFIPIGRVERGQGVILLHHGTQIDFGEGGYSH